MMSEHVKTQLMAMVGKCYKDGDYWFLRVLSVTDGDVIVDKFRCDDGLITIKRNSKTLMAYGEAPCGTVVEIVGCPSEEIPQREYFTALNRVIMEIEEMEHGLN